jgi:ribonuclease BN (tRNA processing enzyme)
VITVRFLGAGDAFGSGGRFQACISVQGHGAHVLLDCGASSLIAMKRFGVEPGSVNAIIVSHLHGDHFGGIPFMVLDAQSGRRDRPLVLAGPPGLRERVVQAMEVLFPGSSTTARRFELCFVELTERVQTAVGAVAVTGYQVPHASGAPAYALRLVVGDKVIAYSGDTAWTEALIDAARGSDLFICEAYTYDREIKNHLAYATLRAHRSRFACGRIILTHMSPDMLARQAEAEDEPAYDGLTLTL